MREGEKAITGDSFHTPAGASGASRRPCAHDTCRAFKRWTRAALCVAVGLCLGAWKDDVGYTSLQARLGGAIPTGADIQVSQVEAPTNGTPPLIYLPDSADSAFVGKTITAKSPGSTTPSGHATLVGTYYYGLSSLAPGITLIDAYEANNWIGSGAIRVYTNAVPRVEAGRAQNHSWIGSFNNTNQDADILRRADFMAVRDGVVIAAGVNNGTTGAMPKLMCSAYNILAVGRTDGNSSRGPTTIDAVGRVKPDIVAPINATSYAAPMVAGAGALLVQVMENEPLWQDLTPSAEALIAKSVLMAGATKGEFTDWRKGFSSPSSNGTVPLDYRYGVGELNIDNSHLVLTSGWQPASETLLVGLLGWDYAMVHASAPQRYFFEVPADQQATLSVLVTWPRHVFIAPDFSGDGRLNGEDIALFQDCATGPNLGPPSEGCAEADLDGDGDVDQTDFAYLQRQLIGDELWDMSSLGLPAPLPWSVELANIDLYLREAVDFVPGNVLDLSISAVDNVEHVYQVNLGSGRYVIEVAADRAWEYALSWHTVLTPVTP